MIAALFVFITGLVATVVIERPSQALVALLLVCCKFWLPVSHDYEIYAINTGWAAILLCILVSRLHWGLGLALLAVYGFRLVGSCDVMDCTGFSRLIWWSEFAALLVSAVSVRRAAVGGPGLPEGVGLTPDRV
ncbi:hypothetical protein ABS71_10400 [bacterium SCN 62-11]|nr:MAG: hypothetical protein ABS71_10400 [bacterium SCN 62-11]